MSYCFNNNNSADQRINDSVIAHPQFVFASMVMMESLTKYIVEVLLKPIYFINNALANRWIQFL